MKLVLVIVGAVIATGCHSMTSSTQPEVLSKVTPTETQKLEHPLLRFEVVPIPDTGVAEEVVGDVKVFVEKKWEFLPEGSEVGFGSKVQLGAGSLLRLRFASNESAELKSPGKESWLVFEQARVR